MSTVSAGPLAPLVRGYFLDRLVQQRNVSPATLATYRDGFRLFLRFAERHLRRPAASFTVDDVDAPIILAFLDDLEHTRKNTLRSRNARLAVFRSFAHYLSTATPTVLPATRRILAIPAKRHHTPVLGFLSRDEMQAVLEAPDTQTWSGQRDRALWLALYNTGARISEALDLNVEDVQRAGGHASVTLHGKGRKQRSVPLWPRTTRLLATWLDLRGGRGPDALFINRRRERLSRSGAAHRLGLSVAQAAVRCPSLRDRHVSLHTVRHTTAMHLLQAGTDTAVIALWLGHESPTTTHAYLEADLTMKERALARVDPPKVAPGRFKPTDSMLAFLEGLPLCGER